MKNKYTHAFALAAISLLMGCTAGKADVDNTAGRNDAIRLNGGQTTVALSDMGTRAAPGFPNGGKIGVVAAYHDPDSVDWTSYADISNTPATAMTLSNGTYFFEWDTDPVKYWPFDGREIVFMAYSPVAGDNNMLLSATNDALHLVLDDDMPDVLYASANTTAAKTPYSKLSPSPVSLGEFRHAMSQVVVELIVAPGVNDVTLTHLSLTTLRRNATFFLSGGDDGLDVVDEELPYEFVFISERIGLPANSTHTENVFLYPGTEDYTSVSIGLLGPQGDAFDRTYPMFFFQSNNPLHLERAKRTTLRILITANTVSDPTPTIDLKGVLSDWDQRGNFGMTVN